MNGILKFSFLLRLEILMFYAYTSSRFKHYILIRNKLLHLCLEFIKFEVEVGLHVFFKYTDSSPINKFSVLIFNELK